MKLSYKGDYALKTLLDLCLHGKKTTVRIKDISERQDIPVKYLEQIMTLLKGSGYVNSKRGPEGGYSLGKKPENITLGEIVRLIEGHTSPIACVSSSCYKKCDDEAGCPFKKTWFEVKNAINEIVDKTTIADICERAEKTRAEKTANYQI
ncbi:MAG: hypothetical protein A2452_06530 [Candidatus Firestonebacteria bacterium RIFOXYC2_FULL_39_67]|nr:MAG: hypothetical protein A2452_06530 [Candidatus Firestonebacteria bacterium RIFOXYC2_FULL_39_67]